MRAASPLGDFVRLGTLLLLDDIRKFLGCGRALRLHALFRSQTAEFDQVRGEKEAHDDSKDEAGQEHGERSTSTLLYILDDRSEGHGHLLLAV